MNTKLILSLLHDFIPPLDCRKKFELNEAKRKAQFELARKQAAYASG